MKKLDVKLIEGKKIYDSILTIKENSFLITTEDSYMVKVLYNSIKDYQVDGKRLVITMNNNCKVNLESESIDEIIKTLEIKHTSIQSNKNVVIKGNNNNPNDSYTEQLGNISNNQVMNNGNNKVIAVLISALPFVAAFVFYMLLINPSNDIGDRTKMRKCIQTWEQYYYSAHFYCSYVESDDIEDFKAVYNCNLDNSKKEAGHTYFNPQYVITIDKEDKYSIGAVLPSTGDIQMLSADCGND